jgi:hypothetical protein
MKHLILLLLLSVTSLHADNRKIGVYDSRSIAIAFAGSALFEKWMAPLMTEMKKAQAAGNKDKIAQLTAQGQARQNKLHTQAFNGTPVTDILELIEDQLPAVKKKTGANAFISKWNQKKLAHFKGAQTVDVTEALIDVFEPSRKQRKSALDIQKKKPIPLKK